jgi:hypothetical protein
VQARSGGRDQRCVTRSPPLARGQGLREVQHDVEFIPILVQFKRPAGSRPIGGNLNGRFLSPRPTHRRREHCVQVHGANGPRYGSFCWQRAGRYLRPLHLLAACEEEPT